ncbi:MAG: amidase [Chloroflexi bacterium]|nr:MAG: Amidase [Chloroflexi bacterium OLB13]MBC6956401.1 amidase [Chloroflexota bacterium]MBV6438114.1 putative amidase AmiD [Anaerolineae bacterium]MDL1917066.1 amidase [Anaerolineae bacterium CFX4]MBW7880171.1 amidase [Anaerolineae bacterium]
MTRSDDYVDMQAKAQAEDADSPLKQSLDFTPFDAAIDALTPGRIGVLDARIQGASVAQIQAALSRRETTSAELVAYYVERIRRIDHGRHNAVLELNPDALRIAAQLDAERSEGRVRGPLHGIPVTLKANIGTGDAMHTSAGAAALAALITDRDAYLVTLLRKAGAVILAKNNLSEWANFYTQGSINGFSVLGGHTRNPFGLFDAGGSSSGSCVAVALGLTPLSIGSETTGSIVYPASQNGVVGLKPSVGLVSRDRIVPITDAFDTAGPLARTAADAAALMMVIASDRDDTDPASAEAIGGFGLDYTIGLQPDGLRGVRVGLVTREEDVRTGDSTVHAQIARWLTGAGAVVVRVPPLAEFAGKETDERLASDSFQILLMGYRLGVEAFLHAQGDRAPIQTLAELVAYNAEQAEARVPYGQTYIEQAAGLSDEVLALYNDLVDATVIAYRDAINDALRKYDVAFFADFANYASPYHSRAGYPALTLPAGRRDSGEPLGVTLFSGWLRDADLLRWGHAYEIARSEAG